MASGLRGSVTGESTSQNPGGVDGGVLARTTSIDGLTDAMSPAGRTCGSDAATHADTCDYEVLSRANIVSQYDASV